MIRIDSRLRGNDPCQLKLKMRPEMSLQVVILAAGLGKRMHSRQPKVLHELAGKSLLSHVISAAKTIAQTNKPIVIYGHQGGQVREKLAQENVIWIEQKEQLGTGHALQQVLPHIADNANILILYGDVPLISPQTLKKLIEQTAVVSIGMLTANLQNPTGYGRVKRDEKNHVIGVIEEKDATLEERKIQEINTGIYFVPAMYLKKWLPLLHNNNAQKEYYLTDIITHAHQEKIPIHTVQPLQHEEIYGVNDRVQLAQLERFYQQKIAEKLMLKGVTIIDPARLDVRGDVQIGKDVTLDVNVILEGKISIGDNCTIGANTILRDVVMGKGVAIKANCVIEGANINDECVIGPFARIRPETTLKDGAHVGNFVEIKKSDIGLETKINHLSYIGDSKIGDRVNIGAGTITCNYDGANKHKTIIGDDVHIGSDTQLVAPVTVGEGATIAAGSTIIKDVPPKQLTLTQRIEQRSKEWKRPQKKQKVSEK